MTAGLIRADPSRPFDPCSVPLHDWQAGLGDV